jgi:Hpt domain
MDEIVKDFLIESNENLDRLDQELVKLESDPSSKELLASVFRTIHTIKGSCGLFDWRCLGLGGLREAFCLLRFAPRLTRGELSWHFQGFGRLCAVRSFH